MGNAIKKVYSPIEQLMGVPQAEQRADDAAKSTRQLYQEQYAPWKYNFYHKGTEIKLPNDPLNTRYIYKRPVFAPGYKDAESPALQEWLKVPVAPQKNNPISESFNTLPTTNKKTANMNYTDFVKQAVSLGDAASWAWDKTKSIPGNLIGAWSPVPMGNPLKLDSYRLYTPFANKTTAFSDYKQPDNPYNDKMTTQQKFDTFQNDVRSQVNKQIGADDVAVAGIKKMMGLWSPGIWSPIPLGNPFKLDSYRVFTPFGDKTTAFSKDKTEGRGTIGSMVDKAMGSKEVQAAADRFINATNIDDAEYMQRNFDQMIEAAGGINSPQGKKLANYITTGMQSKVWDAVKQNPIKNLPTAISMWLRGNGMEGMADFVKNPMVFYGGILAALAGGTALIGGIGGGSGNAGGSSSQPIVINNGGGYDQRMNRVPYS